jgi:ADP-heptose:LPS heptosyltransferase
MIRERPVRAILMMQLAAMGDVILCTPAVRAMRRAYPDARIDFLTRGPGIGALQGNPHIDEVIAYRESVLERLAMRRELRARRYDLVVDFHSVPRTARIVATSGAAVRVGFRGRGPRNLAYTHLVPKERIFRSYSAWRKVDMLRTIGVDPGPDEELDLSLVVGVGDEERQWAVTTWDRLGLATETPTVAISAVSREWFKNWGPERWDAVADLLLDAGVQVILTNGPGELAQVEAVVERMRFSPVWNYGDTTVRQLAALYERCALWVGNDGGPKHVAVAAGTPTVSVVRWDQGPIWSDDRPGSWELYFDKAPPQGCDRKCHRCLHLGCLTAVTVEEVVGAGLDLLGRKGLTQLAPPSRTGTTR